MATEGIKVSEMLEVQDITESDDVHVVTRNGDRRYKLKKLISPPNSVGSKESNGRGGEIFNSYEDLPAHYEYINVATGDFSHAEGNGTKAQGPEAHAEGYKTLATAKHSHAQGNSTQARGEASHAQGYKTKANGKYSHAGGMETETTNEAECSMGRFNKSNPNTISSIGIGESSNKRKNAAEVMKDGRIFIVNVGGYDGTNPTLSKDVAQVINEGGSGGGPYDDTAVLDRIGALETNKLDKNIYNKDKTTFALKTELEKKSDELTVVQQTSKKLTLVANTYNVWATPIDTLSIDNQSFGGTEEYVLKFTTAGTFTNFSLSGDVKWAGTRPTINPNKTYLISIVDNIAVGSEVK